MIDPEDKEAFFTMSEVNKLHLRIGALEGKLTSIRNCCPHKYRVDGLSTDFCGNVLCQICEVCGYEIWKK